MANPGISYKDEVQKRYRSAQCKGVGNSYFVYDKPGDFADVLGVAATANAAWKTAYFKLRTVESASTPKKGAKTYASFAHATKGPETQFTVRCPRKLADRVKAHCRSVGMSFQDYTVQLYARDLGIGV